MAKLLVFLFVSVPVLWFSWPYLRDRSKHGFYRFFVFECIIVLFLFNVDRWFADPFALAQLISWILLSCSMIVAIHGFLLLRRVGQPKDEFENTTRLVTVGAYRYIRHPLYASLLFLSWGIFFKDMSVLAALLTVVASVFLFATARIEESENLAKFGTEYSDYVGSTKMFIPFVF